MKTTILIAMIIVIAAAAGSLNRASLASANEFVPGANGFQKNSGRQEARADKVTEEYHQSYPLSGAGVVSIGNINGDVHISVWDQDEVKIDAEKSAGNVERLNEATIEVVSTSDRIRIKTKYPERDNVSGQRREGDYRATVTYQLTIPRKARVDTAEVVNGSLEILGVEGEIQAACVNGNLIARELKGDVKLSNVNGIIEASMATLTDSKAVTLNSVNGNILLIVRSNSNAEIRANTLHGAITNDFGLKVNDGQPAGHSLSGQIGSGGTRVHLSNVNGQVAIKQK